MALNLDDTKLSSYSDAQLVEYIQSLRSLPGRGRITPLSSKYLSKAYYERDLADAMRAVEAASELGLCVPRVHRIVRADDDVYCIMDRIDGATLEAAWPALGWLRSVWLALQLRSVVQRLRSVKSSSAGSLETGTCRSFYLDDAFGLPPRADPSAVFAFLNFWSNFLSVGQEVKKTAAGDHATCPETIFCTDASFVLTHHDLAPRNLILDRRGQLWILDWDDAGFYPRCFEYAAMHNFEPSGSGWDRSAMRRWRVQSWIACGLFSYAEENRWLRLVRSRSRRFRSARRFNMSANGYAAVAGRSDRSVSTG